MIIKIVQDDYIELAIELTDENDDKVGLENGQWLEFVSTVRTKKYDSDSDGMKGKTVIKENVAATDSDDNYVIKIDTKEYHIVPGTYSFELNLMKPNETNTKILKTNLLNKENNQLIVTRRESTDG